MNEELVIALIERFRNLAWESGYYAGKLESGAYTGENYNAYDKLHKEAIQKRKSAMKDLEVAIGIRERSPQLHR